MSTFKKSKFTIAGKERNVFLINYKNDDEGIVESKTVDTMHHIHILDRSYSMSGSIVALMDDVKKTFREIPVGDYISVVWFSSEGQNGVVIKGYRKTENDDFSGVDKLVDSIKNCVGCTCFHEPMELVRSIIDEMKPLCPFYNVTLFTDGCSCCNVSPDIDYNMTYETVVKFKEDIMALNTLGYGYYYDKDFLTKIAELTDFGKYIHSSNVKEYSEIFTHNYERVKDMVAERVDITAAGCEILYLNSKSTKLTNEVMNLSSIEKRKNQFLVILPDDDCNITINGEVINTGDYKEGKVPDTTVLNLLYALAYENYYKGNRETCLDILKDLKDKYLIDEQLKAFTIDETSKFLKTLNKCIFNNPTRYQDGKAPDNYLPGDDAPCIMDLLRILCKEGNCYIPDISSYKRIGLQVEDTFNLFEPNRDYEIFAPFADNLVYNKNKLNISIRFTRDGVVKLNPRSAKNVGLSESIDAKQYQTHTIIKDGHLNLETIKVKLTKDSYESLREAGLLGVLKGTGREHEWIYEIDLTSLPVINRSYLNQSNIEGILTVVKTITDLEVYQKVLNWKLSKNSYKPLVSGNVDKASFNEEQFAVLNEHGITGYYGDGLVYSGVNRKVTEKNENDYYEARELEFMLKGCSAIPAIEKGLETYETAISKGKVPNFMANCIHNKVESLETLISNTANDPKEERNVLEAELKDTKDLLMVIRNRMSAMKMAKVLTGSWWEELVVDKDKWIYKDPNSDNVLVVKTGYEKVYFN